MPSYTTSLRLIQPATGEYSGSWGTQVNNGITALVDASIAGTASVTMTAANYTLTTANGATDESRAMFLVLGGTPGASYQVIVPAVSKLYFVTNNTTGGFAQTVKTASGSGISVPNGARMTLRCDGTDVLVAQNYFASLTLGSALPVASGGTGSTSTTYCSLTTNVTGTLPIANGGTGQATAQAAINALAGATTSGQFLRGNGTNVVMSAIQVSDVPTLNQNTTGTASNVTGVVAVANGGTGSTSTTYCSLTTNVTGTLPVANGGTGITSFGTGVATWLGTPSSANLAAAVTDETGSGALVFGTSPTLTDPVVTSLNTGQLAGMRNKIINGKMEVAQRGTTFAAIANGAYSLDRWQFVNSSAAVITASQQADVPSSNEYQNSLRLTVTPTADASIAAGDTSLIQQKVEGFNARDLIGKTFTLSFWVRSSKTGTHCVFFTNSGLNRSFVTEYTVSAANTWEYKTITVSGGLITAGTWDWTNGVGFSVGWVLAAGTTFQTTAGAWQTGNFYGTANQVNCLDAINNIFAITGVQLEVGGVATPFEHRPIGVELALCQRYTRAYSANTTIGAGLGTGTTSAEFFWAGSEGMRVTPTVAGTYTANARYVGGNFAVSAFSAVANGRLDATHASNAAAAGQAAILNVATGTLLLSSEL